MFARGRERERDPQPCKLLCHHTAASHDPVLPSAEESPLDFLSFPSLSAFLRFCVAFPPMMMPHSDYASKRRFLRKQDARFFRKEKKIRLLRSAFGDLHILPAAVPGTAGTEPRNSAEPGCAGKARINAMQRQNPNKAAILVCIH